MASKKTPYVKGNKLIFTLSIKIDVELWHDKESDCFICYSKKYDISGYGKTRERATSMFSFCVKEILVHSKPKRTKKS